MLPCGLNRNHNCKAMTEKENRHCDHNTQVLFQKTGWGCLPGCLPGRNHWFWKVENNHWFHCFAQDQWNKFLVSFPARAQKPDGVPIKQKEQIVHTCVTSGLSHSYTIGLQFPDHKLAENGLKRWLAQIWWQLMKGPKWISKLHE